MGLGRSFYVLVLFFFLVPCAISSCDECCSVSARINYGQVLYTFFHLGISESLQSVSVSGCLSECKKKKSGVEWSGLCPALISV